tara:strand:+ start:277 stop:441 length:165 start_codon:yes stop_codon:yes gene_type:complete
MGTPFKLKNKKDFDFGNKGNFDFSKEHNYRKKFDYSGEPDKSHEPSVKKEDKKK